MEKNLLQHKLLTEAFTENDSLKSAGNWARFIGVVFIIFALFALGILIFIFTNLSDLANQFMQLNGMSDQAMEFILGAGKWIFAFFMIIIASVLLVNAYYLINFQRKGASLYTFKQEINIQVSLHFLSRYLFISTLLGVLSTLLSLIAILYFA